MSDWQPIETAPKDGNKIIVGNEDGSMDICNWVSTAYEEQEFVRTARDGDVYRTVRHNTGYWDTEIWPTHWMPLPEPPK